MRVIDKNVLGGCVAVALLIATTPASAAETCGNGIDDDSDGYADEGCGFSNSVMGMCPTPTSVTRVVPVPPLTV